MSAQKAAQKNSAREKTAGTLLLMSDKVNALSAGGHRLHRLELCNLWDVWWLIAARVFGFVEVVLSGVFDFSELADCRAGLSRTQAAFGVYALNECDALENAGAIVVSRERFDRLIADAL